MRIPSRCDSCQVGKMLTYVTRRFDRHVVRYRRCSHCRTTDKTVQMIFNNRIESSTNPSPLAMQPFIESWQTNEQTNAQEEN
jgi:hypothetical protein